MSMRSWRSLPVLVAMALAAAVGGCSRETRQAIGIERTPPDEFTVVTRAPLAMPPDFGLRPPAPGETRPQEGEVKDQALDILVRSAAAEDKIAKDATGKPSGGETALLERAGATNTDPAIRAKVDSETAKIDASEQTIVDKLVFWRKPEPPGTVLDADKEQRRLRENAALGTPAVAGPTPVIKRRERGWLEGIF